MFVYVKVRPLRCYNVMHEILNKLKSKLKATQINKVVFANICIFFMNTCILAFLLCRIE